MFGDFNDLLHKDDKWGRVDHPQSLMDGFRMALEDCNLSELELCEGKFTWEKSKGKEGWVKEKLDHVFSTAIWMSKFPLCKLLFTIRRGLIKIPRNWSLRVQLFLVECFI